MRTTRTNRVRTVPAGRGDRIVKAQREQLRIQRERSQRMLLIGFVSVAALLAIIALSQGDLMTLLFGMLLLGFAFVFIRSRLGSADESRIPKVLVKHEPNEMPPFVDATGTLAGSLLGDVRHDPFQSGGMETPAHDRVEPGAIHRAHGGVLYIDEINLLRLHERQALLTAMQERAFPISGRSERSSGALTKTEAVPCDFVLIAAGNLDAIKGCTPPFDPGSVGMDTKCTSTVRCRIQLATDAAWFVSSHRRFGVILERSARSLTSIAVRSRRSSEKHSGGRADVASSRPRLRELGGLVRIAGDLAAEDGSPYTTREHVALARSIAKPLEQQVADRMIERRQDYSMLVNSGERIGRVNGLAVLGADSGLSDFSGIMLPVEALVTPSFQSGGHVLATGGLSDIAKESVTNVSAVIKKLTGKDVADYDIHIQFVDTHGVDGDSASITIATAIISALENIPIRQDLAMTGSLSVRGEVLPIGGVTAKIEARLEVASRRS